MKIVVIGLGHVGLVTAATLAKAGHEVVGIDHDASRVELLKRGTSPFYEPGLPGLLAETMAASRLKFTTDAAEGVPQAEVAFICVGTPSRPDGEANLLAVEKAAASVATHAANDMVIVQKSTVPVQTAERLKKVLERDSPHRFRLVSNPEFLSEGRAVEDSLHPERVLVGAEDEEAHRVIREVYEPLLTEDVAYHATDVRTAELAKHACNAFLALKISYANALARICEAAGADVVAIADIMGTDSRIGRAFLNAGLGFGGYCFPKDVAAFKVMASRLGYDFALLDEVERINAGAIDAAFDKVREAVWNLEGKRIAVLGLSFKPGTDDVRESPALNLVRRLTEGGARVIAFDPQAADEARRAVPGMHIAPDSYAAADGSDCVVIATDWPEFAGLDLPRLKGIMTHPVIVDARNIFDPRLMADAGFTYVPTGRPAVNL